MTTKPPTLEEILSQAKSTPRISTAKVLLRQDLATRHTEAEAELSTQIAKTTLGASLQDAGDTQRIAERVQAVEAEIRDAEVEFKFQSIGRKAWADLLARHPPTTKQKTADKRTTFNPETFPLAAIAASCVQPAMDVDGAGDLEELLSDAQFSQLWNACVDANLGGGDSPNSLLAGRILHTNVRSATTAASEESPEASS